MCQMPNIWHIWHTKHKKHLPSDVLCVPNFYHLCPYRCKYLAFGTPSTKNTSHQMFYVCQIFTICVRTAANLQRYGHKCQTEKYYFIRLFSLLSFLYLFSLFLESVSLSQVLPLLTIRHEQEEGSTEEGGGGNGGQERRKGSRNFVEIGCDGRSVRFINGGRWVCHGGESLSWVHRWW